MLCYGCDVVVYSVLRIVARSENNYDNPEVPIATILEILVVKRVNKI